MKMESGILMIAALLFAGNALAGACGGADLFCATAGSSLVSSFSSMGPTNVHKVAILHGEAPAIAVLNGELPDDAFMNAYEAAEALTGKEFKSDREGALAILELAESLDPKADELIEVAKCENENTTLIVYATTRSNLSRGYVDATVNGFTEQFGFNLSILQDKTGNQVRLYGGKYERMVREGMNEGLVPGKIQCHVRQPELN